MALFGRKKTTVGLDIGSGLIKVAVIDHSKAQPELVRLAVAPLLRSSVPERFVILGREAKLPALPEFRINLYAPPGLGPAARDLADHVRASFSGRSRNHNN